MRGLLFTGGKQPDMNLASPFFSPYSYAVAADSGLCGAEMAGVVPDMIVGDMDSLPDPSMLDKYSSDHIQFWSKDKDFTDTELALQVMESKKIDEVILVGGGGGRYDHFFALKALFDQKKELSMWIGEESIVMAVDSTKDLCGVRVFGLDADDPVSVFPSGCNSLKCRGIGFHWPIDSISWETHQFSLSNRSDSGKLEFEAVFGRFLLIVPLHSSISIESF